MIIQLKYHLYFVNTVSLPGEGALGKHSIKTIYSHKYYFIVWRAVPGLLIGQYEMAILPIQAVVVIF